MNLIVYLLSASTVLAGYPLFFASFENVGESVVGQQTQPFEEVDDQITGWLTECQADTFIIIKDSNPVDTTDLYHLKKFAQQALTTGTFMTDFPINMYDLADDIATHCQAPLRRLDIYADEPVERELNQRRTFYIEFDSTDKVDKSEFLLKAMAHLTSPYVTMVYSSSFGVPNPIFPHVDPDPKRAAWTEKYSDRYEKQVLKTTPKVEPLVDRDAMQNKQKRIAQQKASALRAQYKDYLPDDTFVTLFVATLGAVCVLLLKNAIF